MLRMVADITKKIAQAPKEFKNQIEIFSMLVKNVKAQATNRALSGRALNTAPAAPPVTQLNIKTTNNNDPFKSDSTIMTKQDNMFNAFDGAKGTTLDSQFRTYQPLDTQINFP